MECTTRCYSPIACAGFGYCRNRNEGRAPTKVEVQERRDAELKHGIWYNKSGTAFAVKSIAGGDVYIVRLHPNTLEESGDNSMVMRERFGVNLVRRSELQKPV